MLQTPTSGVNIADALADGQAVELGGRDFIRQQVVTTGITLNSLSNVNTQNRTFDADFYIFFRYTGDDTATDVVSRAAQPH